jgi:anaerobic magnesium-protoporphyrin IX monomethyl ester cyclase
MIQPPVRVDHDPIDIPAGLGIMASIAINEGHQVALLDLNIHRPVPSWRKIAEQIQTEKWDLIAIGGLSSMYEDIKKVLYLSRKFNPDALIVCGGGFITYMPDKIMKFNPSIDIGVIGEGEETFREILQSAESKNWKPIRGICFREDEKLIYTEPRPLIPDMDVIPHPAYDLMDIEEYFKYSGSMWYNGAFQSKRRINFVTERGCPRQCTFCTHNGMNRWDQLAMLGKEKVEMLDKEAGFQAVTRFFSPKYVVNHALWLSEKYDIDYICLLDENLTSNNKRVHELCDLWIQEGLHKKIKLGTSGDAPSINPDVVKHMKEAGFTFIAIGGESGSDKIMLEDIGKGVTVADTQKSIDILKAGGISPSMTFMVGNPNENINDVLDTVSFLIKNNIDVGPFICTPYPGTKIFMDNQDFILQQYDERLNILAKSPNPNISPEQISKWKDDALETFLLSLNNATDYSCTVSKHFDFSDLLTIKYFMKNHDMSKLLKLAHMRGWPHESRWNNSCPVCSATDELAIKIEN